MTGTDGGPTAGPGAATAATVRVPRSRLASWSHDEAFYLIEILALCSFTFTRPILQIFGDDPQTFLAQGAGRPTVVLFALGVALVPAAAIWAAAATTRILGPLPRRVAQSAALGALAALFTRAEVVRATGWPRLPVWFLALAAGAAVGALCWFAPPFRSFLHFASLSAPIFVALFVVASPVSQIFGSSDAHAVGVEDGPPILWVVFDELPTASLLDGRGGIDAGLFPNFAALAGDATWYRNNTTVGTITQNAVPAIMTGRYATEPYTVPVSSNYPDSIFTLLGRDYRMHVSERVTHVCPPDLCRSTRTKGLRAQLTSLFGEARSIWPRYGRRTEGDALRGFSVGDDPVDTQRVGAFHDFLDGMHATRGPRLDFAHILLPHQPWELLPDEKSYQTQNDGLVYFAWSSDDAGRIARQRHLLQLQLADRYLGAVLDRLRAEGDYDDSVIVVTADHGAAFGSPQPQRALDAKNVTDIAFTPLLIKAPHQKAGRVDDRDAETIDALPTVADLLDVRIPWKVDGRSLLGAPRPDDRRTIVVTPRDTVKADRRHRFGFRAARRFRELMARPAATPPGPPGLRVFATGQYGGLVGRTAAGLTSGGTSRYRGHFVLGPRPYDPASTTAPVYYRAEVDAPNGTPIAIVVNGRISASMHTIPSILDRANLWGVVPESFLRPGTNDVRLYEIDGPPGDATLRPIPTT